MEKNRPAESTASREIFATRLLDAPRELVWKVWTDPQHIAQWWGPNGFTNTIHQMDVRPGGVWDFIMHGPDGTNYKNKNVFAEVVPLERLSYDHVSMPKHHVDVTFEAVGNQTKLTFRMTFETPEEREAVVKKFGAVEGLNQTLGRLAGKLASETGGGSATAAQPSNPGSQKEVVLTRTVACPLALVFKTWTDAKHVQQWWGPKDFHNPVCEWDARPGGKIHVDMRSPEGVSHPCKGVFREIVENERLVFTVTAFEDENGHPKLENLNTVTFSETNGRTTFTLRVQVLRYTPDLAGPLEGMEAGWGQSLDKLVELVAKN